jgi:hypothetical protein
MLACLTSGHDGECGSQACQAGALRRVRPGKRSRDERRRARARDWWIASGRSPAVVLETLVSEREAQQPQPASRLHQPIHPPLLDDANDRRPTTPHDTLPLVRHAAAAAHCPSLPPATPPPPLAIPSLCDAGTTSHTAAHHRIACPTAQRLPPCHGAVGHMASLRGSFTPTAASTSC